MGTKLPTHMRYHRVAQILAGDNALRQKLSAPELKVQRTDGNYDTFPKEVVAITDILHRDGKDALIAPKAVILMKAAEVLLMGKEPLFFLPRVQEEPAPSAQPVNAPPEVKQAVTPVPEPVLEKAEEPVPKDQPTENQEVKVVKKVKVVKPKVETTEATQQPSTPEIACISEPVQEVKKPEATPVPEKSTASATVRIQPATAPVKKENDSNAKFKNFALPWVHSVSIFSLLASAHSLIDKEMQSPQREEMLADVLRVLEKLQQCTKIPKSA